MSCGIDHRRGSDPALLWLWHKPAVTAPTWPLAWEPPSVEGCGPKKTKQNKMFHNIPCLYFYVFIFFRGAAPAAYGGSQGRGPIGATVAGLHHSHSNEGSLTHWAKPRMEPITSWFLVRFVFLLCHDGNSLCLYLFFKFLRSFGSVFMRFFLNCLP